jgi:hypothetical protein
VRGGLPASENRAIFPRWHPAVKWKQRLHRLRTTEKYEGRTSLRILVQERIGSKSFLAQRRLRYNGGSPCDLFKIAHPCAIGSLLLGYAGTSKQSRNRRGISRNEQYEAVLLTLAPELGAGDKTIPSPEEVRRRLTARVVTDPDVASTLAAVSSGVVNIAKTNESHFRE